MLKINIPNGGAMLEGEFVVLLTGLASTLEANWQTLHEATTDISEQYFLQVLWRHIHAICRLCERLFKTQGLPVMQYEFEDIFLLSLETEHKVLLDVLRSYTHQLYALCSIVKGHLFHATSSVVLKDLLDMINNYARKMVELTEGKENLGVIQILEFENEEYAIAVD